MNCYRLIPAFVFVGVAFCCECSAEDLSVRWLETGAIAAPEARQAAAAEGDYVYAVNNTLIAKYDRKTKERIALSRGDAHHLNSGFVHDHRMYCAHSNYPHKPERSTIKALDLQTMELTDYHSFGESPHGSLTWAVLEQGAWWCLFAHYGKDNDRTVLVKFDSRWNELGVWTIPASVLSDLGNYSLSGGVWWQGQLLTTGHDKGVMYQLEVPPQGSVLKHVGTVEVPFRGQGIALDPVTGGLIGIRRKELEIVFAEPPSD